MRRSRSYIAVSVGVLVVGMFALTHTLDSAHAVTRAPGKVQSKDASVDNPVTRPITDRCELLARADEFAIDNLGFQDADKNGIPDYREWYSLQTNDCSTVSAQFDWILEKMAEAGALDPSQGLGACQVRGGIHAANVVPAIGIVDVTPIIIDGNKTVASQGQCWYEFPANSGTWQQGIPDHGEVLDPAYEGPGSAADPRVLPGAPTVPTTPVVIQPTPPGRDLRTAPPPPPQRCTNPRLRGCRSRLRFR